LITLNLNKQINKKAAYRQAPIVRRSLQRFNSTAASATEKKPYSKWKLIKNTAKLGAVGFVGYTFYSKCVYFRNVYVLIL
jgi:NADH:ubiquinone reductase (non-electrogenic)